MPTLSSLFHRSRLAIEVLKTSALRNSEPFTHSQSTHAAYVCSTPRARLCLQLSQLKAGRTLSQVEVNTNIQSCDPDCGFERR